MAEAVAAFGLAANILQFLEFTSNLISNFRTVYSGGKDGLLSLHSVGKVTKDLQSVLQDLHISNVDDTEHGESFQRLANDCDSVAQELLILLASVNTGGHAGSKLSALRAVLRAKWKEEDITRLQNKLNLFRSQLTLHLISSLRVEVRKSEDQQKLILRNIDNILTSNESIKSHVNQQIAGTEELGARVIDMVVSKLTPDNRIQEKGQLEHHAINRLLKSDIEFPSAEPQIPVQRFEQLSKRILVRLRYNAIEDREANIINAHAETFKWIFNENERHSQKWTNLPRWLESSSQLYWVTGKAGSGKSTLMKYIACSTKTGFLPEQAKSATHTRSRPYLEQWAPAPLKLIVATHFFWNSGATVQMTQSGLLRSLLYQILSQEPALIPKATPARWEALCIFGADLSPNWSLEELLAMFRLIVSNLETNMRLCLFIDGLDEFDGDHHILTNLCRELVRNPVVKLCAASRPLEVFERAFEQEASLRMEDLTYDDIHAYVESELTASSDFSALKQREPLYSQQLIQNIVSKASGVFLWVRLVVSSLLAGLIQGDRVSDLQRRLDLLPPQLERLYDKMLDSIDPFYHEHSAQLFTLVQSATEPLKLGLLSLIDDGLPSNMALPKRHDMTEEDFEGRLDTMRRRINSRTKGLLEVTRPIDFDNLFALGLAHRTVQYLHRTVRDYMALGEVRKRIKQALVLPFNPYERICIALLASLRSTKFDFSSLISGATICNVLLQFLRTASKIGCGRRCTVNFISETNMNDLIEEFRVTLQSCLPTAARQLEFPVSLPVHLQPFMRPDSESQFYRIAADFGLCDYLARRRLNKYMVELEFSDHTIQHSLVMDAIKLSSVLERSFTPISTHVPNLEVLLHMLENGACLNENPALRTTGLGGDVLIILIFQLLKR